MKNRLIIRSLAGLFAGALIGHIITLLVNCFGAGECSVCMPELIDRFGFSGAIALQTLVSGVFGMISVGGMCFHDIEGWSMLRSSVVHCLLILVNFIPVGIALYWFSFALIPVLIMSGAVIVSYLIIWLIMYILWKREMREMTILNEEYKKSNTRRAGVD